MKRLFVAIDLPVHIKEYLLRVQADLGATHYFHGTFVHQDHFHQTLCFIGNINEKNIPQISNILKTISFSPFRVNLGHLGFFPSAEYISIIWVDLQGTQLASLANMISYALRDIKKKEERDFVSHITLARVKSVSAKDELLNFIEGYKVDNMECVVSEFVLIESELTQQGPIHKTIETFKFGR